MMTISPSDCHTCLYCAFVWQDDHSVPQKCPRCGAPVYYSSDHEQELGIVSPGLVHYTVERPLSCPKCKLLFPRGDTCPRCGQEVPEEMDQSIGLMGEEK